MSLPGSVTEPGAIFLLSLWERLGEGPAFLKHWGQACDSCDSTQGRHHEVQRATVTNFIIIVAGRFLRL